MPQPILGSVEWMRQSMATVHPVFSASIKNTNQSGLCAGTPILPILTDDSQNIKLTDDSGAVFLTSETYVQVGPIHILTDNNGVILTNKLPTSTVVNRLVRWM